MRNLTKVEEHSRRMVQNWLFGLEIPSALEVAAHEVEPEGLELDL